jgi:F-type H+-transporting ATPase subunit gamma
VAAEFDVGTTKFIAVGRKAAQFLARTGRNVIAQFSIADRAPYSQVRPVVETLVRAYMAGEIDTIEVVYPRFINNLRQEPELEQLAPIPDVQAFIEEHKGRKDYTSDAPNPNAPREMLFEPSPREIVGELVELYVRREIYQFVLEAQASEHSARMVAMKTATDNAKELAARLTLKYNKARQAAITQEILEISAATSNA